MKQYESKIFNVKPKLTTAMMLAASFAITYYGLLLIYEVFTLVYSRYFIDSYYFNQGQTEEGIRELWTQIIQLALSVILVFSLIQVFRKKVYGKALFVGLIIAPIRVKKKIKIKDGKLQMEVVEEEESSESQEEQPADSQKEKLAQTTDTAEEAPTTEQN